MIGFNTGEQYEDETQLALGRPLEGPAKPQGSAAGALKSKGGTQVAAQSAQEVPQFHIDQSKDVPLAASALHRDGQFYGIAIDKDAPQPPDSSYHEGVYMHEKAEFDHMKNLVDGGMSPVDAYHEAHDRIATPIESAYIRANAVRNGLNPDDALDAYKNYWRTAASIAGNKDSFDRHPDAHTTTFGLDEAELSPEVRGRLREVTQEQRLKAVEAVKSFTDPLEATGRLMLGKGEDGEDVGSAASNFLPLPKMALFGGALARTFPREAAHEAIGREFDRAWKLPGTSPEEIWRDTGIHFGPEGKPRFEISDKGSHLNLPPNEKGEVGIPAWYEGSNFTLQDVLHHPELYKAYPDLKNMKITGIPEEVLKERPNIRGYYDRSGGTIALVDDKSEEFHSALLHELQHAIQHKEGFASGSSVDRQLPFEYNLGKAKLDKGFDLLKKGLKQFNIKSDVWTALGALSLNPKVLRTKPELEQVANQLKDHPELVTSLKQWGNLKNRLDETYAEGLERYLNVYGEQESRDVQDRFVLAKHTNEEPEFPGSKVKFGEYEDSKTGGVSWSFNPEQRTRGGAIGRQAMGKPDWSKEDWDKVVERYNKGESFADIAKDYPGRSAEGIRSRLFRQSQLKPAPKRSMVEKPEPLEKGKPSLPRLKFMDLPDE